MKIHSILIFVLLSLSCKIFKKDQTSKTNATLQPAGIKKGVFPLVVEQLGISNKSIVQLLKDPSITEPSEDMVLETVVWMQTYGHDVNVQFENPEKNFTRTEVEKISQNTKACLYKTRMIRPMADVIHEQVFNLSKVEEALKSPVEKFDLDKPDVLATPEEVELYKKNKSLWLKAKQDRHAMIRSYKNALALNPSQQPTSMPALSFYGKKRAITHFYESETPILNIIRDGDLGLDKNGQPNYNVRAVPLDKVVDSFSTYTIKKFDEYAQRKQGISNMALGTLEELIVPYPVSYALAKFNVAILGGVKVTTGIHQAMNSKSEISAYMDNLMVHQSLNKQLCHLRQKQPKMVNLENMTTAVLAGKYTPAGIYSMAFLKNFPTYLLNKSDSKNNENFDKYYFRYLLGKNIRPENIDKQKILNAIERSLTISDTGITILGGNFLLNPNQVSNVTTDSANPQKERVSSTTFLSKAILERNLEQIQNRNQVNLNDFEICNPTNIEFMCL